ncbi:ATP-binding cassette domain-containing protein [Kocuria palustris]|uniref:ABC transporter ATP-binding protein n=1 Tax=Kocuria palustris TaxID=71999 RepID=UPI0011A30EE4
MSAPGQIAIAFRGVRKTYPDGTTAVDDLDLEVPRGSLTVFVGPSGCGKTTSLRMINRMVEPTSGAVEVDGRDVSGVPAHELRRSMGYVMQASGLMPHRTVRENIMTVPRLQGRSRSSGRERADELMETIGLDPALGSRYPSQLSGGQQQRVGVARALAADPPILLMDEPFSAVDPLVRADLQRELISLKRRLDKTIVFVTHDMDEAVLLGDRVAVMAKGGRLAQYDTPEQVLRAPADGFVADFVGRDRGFRALEFDQADVALTGVRVRDPQGRTSSVGGEAPAAAWTLEVDDDGRPVGWLAPSPERAPAAPWSREPEPELGDREDAQRVGGSLHRQGAPLRSALDAALSSPSGLAVAVDDDGRVRGVLRPEDVLAEIEAARHDRESRR